LLTGVRNAYRSVGSVVLATLLVVAVLPVGALPVGAALTGTVEVMPLGDSITVGVLGSSNDTGYRRELWLSQAAAGHTLNFVGSGSTGVPGDFDKRHEGHAGMRADEIRDGVTGWLNANSADVVLLHIGTNDISQGQDASSTAIEIGQILNKIKAVDSTTWVIVAKIVPRNDGNNDLQLRTNDLNNRIANLVTARSAAGEQPGKITAALENVVREFDPQFQRGSIVPGVSLRKNSMNDFLKQSAIAGTAGGVILSLSALGIYGVMGLMVAARTREIAVRVALGASRPRVLGMILFDVVKLTTPGVAVGLMLAAALIRLNGENMGIPLSKVETLAYVVGGAIAIVVAVLASVAPARRAASVLPMVAMRSE